MSRRFGATATGFSRVVALATVMTASLVLPPAVDAATYEVAQCRQGDAAVEVTPGFISGIRTVVLNSCGTTGVGFNLGEASNVVSPSTRPGEQAGFEVVVPAALPNTKIVRLQAVLSLSAKTASEPGGDGALSSYSAENIRWGEIRPISASAEPAAPSLLWDRSDQAGSRRLSTVVECGKPCQFTFRPFLVMQRATVTLDDPVLPAAASVESIGLFDGGLQRGTKTVRLSATDADSGVRTIEVRTGGGTTVLARPVDGGDCSFTRPAPCLQSRVQVDAAIDTTKLPDGASALEVWVTDAAGNVRKTTLPTVTVDNRPSATPATPAAPEAPAPLNGAGGDALSGGFVAKSTPARVTVGFAKTFKVGGRLADAAGRPLVGAAVDVSERVAIAGAPTKTVSTVVTDAAGGFVYSATAASNRTLTFSFAQRIGSTTYTATAVSELRVMAAVSLGASRKTAGRGVVVKLTGRVRIADLPKRGARVVLEANTGAGWKIAAIVRSDRTGAFAWSHAFGNAGRYRIRARMLVGADVPARPGTSRIVPLRIR
ncbi:MAG: hypothetical protein Q7T55_01355 [Solirubrobacteraceae bacterium]|nr:hypothetical protein [Solirubrobacteraceae bacterium]